MNEDRFFVNANYRLLKKLTMGLLIGIVLIFVWGALKNSDLSFNTLWQIIVVLAFYWVGSLFAPISEVLSFNISFSIVCAGFFYGLCVLMTYMKLLEMDSILN